MVITLKQLPEDLKVLPPDIIEQLTQQHEVLQGYIKLTEEYKVQNEAITTTLQEQVDKLNKIIDIFDKYSVTSEEINGLIVQVNDTFNKFQNQELIQYQLLSNNFNQDLLKTKFEKLINYNDQESKQLIRENRSKFNDLNSNNDRLNDFLKDFRESRKLYHLRKEKLNRWNEERVTGLL